MGETVIERLGATWDRTDRIFGLLRPEAILARPIALRHPFIFYVGHLPAFAWIHLGMGVLGRPSFDPGFDELVSRGIDPDVDDPTRCHDHPAVPEQWPDLATVLAYRDRVRAAVADSVEAAARQGRMLEMVIEHELMHQETLLYMVQRLTFEAKLRPSWLPAYRLGPGRPGGTVEIPAGRAALGAAVEDLPFGWDNEFPPATVEVPAFRMDATPVTNGQFLEFVAGGGYETTRLWDDDDGAWRRREALAHPVVWEREDGRWWYRTLFDRLPLDDVRDWPVYVSLAEARAYARWRGARLPAEAEFHRAAFGEPGGGTRAFPWGSAPAGEAPGNFDFRRWAPAPVGSHPEAASAWGVHDLIGDGWEWTETPFAGFPGFEANIPGYAGYSADFFDGKHYVLKGASWATAAPLVRPSFRNWFQAHYPYVFAKFRCVALP
ncbi:MAG TPA: SUMF1/EgtB/PvdO family nonheme iron enzyme [Methylomirabilota bacterium]|nr:SUMF1/EgtB/PvdO family nonheme iron enzyme [Methylomirabilota bacterium]